MRDLHLLDAYRMRSKEVLRLYGTFGDGQSGAFLVPSKTDRAPIVCIASVGLGWDHVSASRKNRGIMAQTPPAEPVACLEIGHDLP